MDDRPRPVSESKTLGGFGIVKMEPRDQIRSHSSVGFSRRARVKNIDNKSIHGFKKKRPPFPKVLVARGRFELPSAAADRNPALWLQVLE